VFLTRTTGNNQSNKQLMRSRIPSSQASGEKTKNVQPSEIKINKCQKNNRDTQKTEKNAGIRRWKKHPVKQSRKMFELS